jgi:hypothetical protein
VIVIVFPKIGGVFFIIDHINKFTGNKRARFDDDSAGHIKRFNSFGDRFDLDARIAQGIENDPVHNVVGIGKRAVNVEDE